MSPKVYGPQFLLIGKFVNISPETPKALALYPREQRQKLALLLLVNFLSRTLNNNISEVGSLSNTSSIRLGVGFSY